MDQRPDAPASDGLNRLDLERAASLADEGGAAGAAVEAQQRAPAGPRRGGGLRIAAVAIGFLALWSLFRRDRRRS